MLTYEHLLQRVWGEKTDSDVRAMRTIVSSLRRKLGDDADNPTYIFTEPRVGYRMPRGRRREGRDRGDRYYLHPPSRRSGALAVVYTRKRNRKRCQ